MTDLLTAASAAAGVTLTEPAALASSDRSAVLRCRTASGGTVVVKAYQSDGEGAEGGFAAEAAGLEFTTGTATGPDLIAADPGERLIVMSDLGDAPSLAVLLLGSSAERASAGFLDWAVACGELAVRSAGRQAEFDAILAGYLARLGADPAGQHWLARRIGQVPVLLGELSVEMPDGLEGDLADVATLLSPGQYPVFSPGDICPDNNLVTPDGVRFIDFESAEFHSVFLDAAYLRMPFSSCWCVSRLPAGLALRAESAYRDLVTGVFPDLADDVSWQRGARRAMAAWTLHATAHLLGPSLVADGSMNPEESRAPTARQLLRFRWRILREELESAGELPAISALMTTLLISTESWQSPALPFYPAFR